MPQLPTAENLGIVEAQPKQSVASYTPSDMGLGEIAKSIKNTATEEQESQYREGIAQQAFAKSSFLTNQADIEQQITQNPDYTKWEENYNKLIGDAKTRAVGMVTDPYHSERVVPEIDNLNRIGISHLRGLVEEKKKDAGRASVMSLMDQNGKALQHLRDEAQRTALIDSTSDAIRNSKYLSEQEKQKWGQTFIENVAVTNAENLIASDPAKAASVLAPLQNKSSAAPLSLDLSFIQQHEGGFVSNDSGKGPTLYGINSEANPTEYAKIKELYDKGDTSGAQSLAKQTIQTKYADAIGADKMSPAMALVATDAAVNMGVGKTKTLLAQAGDDPKKLIDLRRAEYARLAKENPEKYGDKLNSWNNRLDDLRGSISIYSPTGAAQTSDAFPKSGDWRDFIPTDKRMELYRAAKAEDARQQRVKDEQDKQARIGAELALVDKLANKSITAQDVMNVSRQIGPEKSVEWLNRVGKEDETTDAKVKNDLFQRIYLPDGDPQKIVSVEQLLPSVGKGIKTSDFKELSHFLEGSPQEQELRKLTMTAVRKKFLGRADMSNIVDPDGEINYAHVVSLIQQKEIEGRKAGIPFTQLYDPASKDWVGNVAQPFIRNNDQRMAAMLGPSAATGGPPPINERVVGKIYDTPNGQMKWVGNGWVRSAPPEVPLAR